MFYKKLNHRLCVGVAAAVMAISAPTATAQDSANDPELSTERAKIVRGNAIGLQTNTPSGIARLIHQNRENRTGNAPVLIVDRQHQGRNGRTHLRMHQEIDGVRVYGSYVKAAMAPDGRLMHLLSRTSRSNGQRLAARVSESEAISAAVSHTFGDGLSADFFHTPPSAEQVMIARRSGQLEEGFAVETWSAADNRLFETLIDSRGRVVSSELRTAQDSYKIFPDHPGVSQQVVTNGPGAGNAESPIGWLSGQQSSLVIRGNNVSTYLDRDANNAIDGGGSVVSDGNFLADYFELQSPTLLENQETAVQNLFYLNNIIHDDLYRHGFVETVGNFQDDNFGNGGAGSDSVNAEAQDGSGTNNANFATPGDGSNPRMQMFLWTFTSPNRDSAVDSDVVWHEYGHGLTWRMIGQMSGSVSGAIGEGMSDVLAILHNNRDTVGSYSTNDSNGIRSAPYTNYTRTIGDFGGTSVHFDGEIYAATLWRLSELVNADGMSNEELMDVVVDGMNFTPAGPDYLDMRDGILAASAGDLTCHVWQAFADYGMGEGATFEIRTGGNPRNRIRINESFSTPSSCTDGGGGGGGGEPPVDSAASVNGLTGFATPNGRKNWTATADVSIADDTGGDASGVVVSATWSTGAGGSCTTGLSGDCSISLGGLRTNRDRSVTLTIDALDGSAATGSPLSVTINRP